MRDAHRRGARRARLRSVGVAPRRCRTGLVVKLRHPVVRGHPLHAMSTDLPIGILPLAFAASVAARLRGSRGGSFAADAATDAAVISVAPAVRLGGCGWLTSPAGHEVDRSATAHGLTNSAAY